MGSDPKMEAEQEGEVEQRDPGYPFGQGDAMKWVDEFGRIFPDARPDDGTMLGWFANAIETGRMLGRRAIETEAPADGE